MSFLSGKDAVHLLRRPVPGAAPSRAGRPARRQVLGSEELIAELRRYVAGREEREDLLPRIWFPGLGRLGREAYAIRDRVARIERARPLLAVILAERFVRDPRAARALAASILSAIDHDRPIPVQSILRRIYGLPEEAVLSARPCGPRRAWRDLAYLAPFRVAAGHVLRQGDWFVALSISTEAFWREGLGGDAAPRWPDPLEGAKEKTVRLRRALRPALCPRKFRYFVDGDGLAFAVLDAPEIGDGEILQAIRLFAADNRLRRVALEGRPVALA